MHQFINKSVESMERTMQNTSEAAEESANAKDLLPSNRELLRSVYDTENSTRSRLQQQENEFTGVK